MSAATDIADAIAASINATSFGAAVNAARVHLPIFDLEKVGNALQVSVVPRSVAVKPASRSTNFFDFTTDIGVQQRIDPGDPAQVDALLDLVEQIGDHLRLSRLAMFTNAQWIATEHDPVLAGEHLERLNVFTSVLTVTHRLTR